MRNLERGSILHVRAISGFHVVTLAWDFAEGQEIKREGLQGFAIERSELQQDQPIERYFLRGIKRFKNKDEGLAPGTPVPTSEHPIQTFQWGDYTAKPNTNYQFKIIPVYGKPRLLELDNASSTTVTIKTEAEAGAEGSESGPRHEIYFNRGAAGSQAFARRFPNVVLDENQPGSEAMIWLSRGLFEALTTFIGLASGEDANDYKLRAMLYEFRYLPIGQTFKRALDAGADVDIRYEAKTYKIENEKMIRKAKIKSICKPQKIRSGIRHNKFIVLIHKNNPVAVWTGSTNISAGGIFGHSNVGHIVWDTTIAERYLGYWDQLAKPDVKTAALKSANVALEPTPTSKPPADRILTLFCPRDQEKAIPTLHWYADLIANVDRIACATFAFNLHEVFKKAMLKNDGKLRYAAFDKNPGPEFEEGVFRIGNTVIAPGAKLEKDDLKNFSAEKLTGFNNNYYIHDKFLLLDPLGDDPVIVTGTANFSPTSQTTGDENMLVIRGDTRVADVYFGEFMRIFDHLYSRYLVRKFRKAGKNDPDAGFLKDKSEEWVPKHFAPGAKALRRRYFMGG